MESVRIDKYLWAIRVFKTRSEATDACNGGKVKLNGVNAKPSKAVKPGDMLDIHKGPVNYSYRIIQLSESRMGAALVPDYAENLTPELEIAKLHAPVETVVLKRDRGTGRPTKKERREIDALQYLLRKE
ncbi:MAG: RNA-binding S4 domain-containing protein [Bacteroidales bacterium]|nr:RNA-binding S4 domain-containing protein [Bacteroidales bacterium]